MCALTVASCGAATQQASADNAVQLTNCGADLQFAAAPSRAVSMEQNATEIMLTLGLEDQMAGTAYQTDRVPEHLRAAYESVPVLADLAPSAEAFRAAAPDFAYSTLGSFFTADGVGSRAELGELGVPVYVSETDCKDSSPAPATFEALFDEYRDIGRIFGVEDRADALVAEQQAIVEAAASAATSDGPTAVWFYSTYHGTPIVAGPEGMPSEISRVAGARNAFDDARSKWTEVSWEEIAGRDGP